MRRTLPARTAPLLASLLAGSLVLSGCDSGSGTEEKGTIRTAPPSSSSSAPAVPDLRPVAEGPCPYLSEREVSDLNGEKVLSVKTDPQVDPPGCFFYAADQRVTLTTSVFSVESEEKARSLVDQSAPPASTERADVEGGWTGGRSGGPGGALLAVAKGPRVVVVQSTQEQSVKVQRIAELVIPRLG